MSALAQDAPRGFVSKAEYYAALKKIDRLEIELAEARERIAQFDGKKTLLAVRNVLCDLSHMEAAFVATLYEAAPRMVANEALYLVNTGWKRKMDVADPHGVVKTHMHHIRRKLRAAGAPEAPIRTFYGSGYLLVAEAHRWLSERILAGATP